MRLASTSRGLPASRRGAGALLIKPGRRRLRKRIRTLLLEGGGKINGTFLAAGFIHEPNLLLARVAGGSIGTPPLFDAAEGKGPGRRLKLLSARRRPAGLVRVRYKVA